MNTNGITFPKLSLWKFNLPNYIQQKHVADFLSSIDDKVKTEFEIHIY